MSRPAHVVSMSRVRTEPHGGFSQHVHQGIDEWCLVTEGTTTIRHAGVDRSAVPGDLFLFRSGEAHGYRNRAAAAPVLWVIHFRPPCGLAEALPVIAASDPEARTWHLDQAARSAFQARFAELAIEVTRSDATAMVAIDAHLRLLATAANRWHNEATMDPAEDDDLDLTALREAVADGFDDRALSARFPAYDALRHRFRRRYGCSPRTMRQRLRMEQAKALLVEGWTLGEISEHLGYGRQHEFGRAFKRVVGLAPGAWRASVSAQGARSR